jgi:bifunctional non-homologous end joining protein LigD
MVPHLAGRAVTLRRFPEGVDNTEAAFFEKRCPKHRPKWVKTTTVTAGPHAGKIDFCVCDSRPTLIWMAQLATIELHPSLSVARRPAQPTVLAFDLDPGPPANVVDCCRIALQLREMFGHFDLQIFPKTTGSKGLQVYLPLNTKSHYDETKPFARALAQLLEKQTGKVVSKMSKEIRKGKVFVDWSQNHPRKTTVAVYSMRARERPTVSTPVSWDEVERCAKKADADLLVFETSDVLKRVEKHGDLFAPVLDLEQKLPSFAQLAGGTA